MAVDGVHEPSSAREFLVIERGTWTFSDEPFALGIVTAGDDGRGQISLEAGPSPAGAPSWPPADEARGQTIRAPFDPDTLELAGPLLAEAVRTWADSPLDVALTFATHDPEQPS
jgi:hypothetical protein